MLHDTDSVDRCPPPPICWRLRKHPYCSVETASSEAQVRAGSLGAFGMIAQPSIEEVRTHCCSPGQGSMCAVREDNGKGGERYAGVNWW